MTFRKDPAISEEGEEEPDTSAITEQPSSGVNGSPMKCEEEELVNRVNNSSNLPNLSEEQRDHIRKVIRRAERSSQSAKIVMDSHRLRRIRTGRIRYTTAEEGDSAISEEGEEEEDNMIQMDPLPENLEISVGRTGSHSSYASSEFSVSESEQLERDSLLGSGDTASCTPLPAFYKEQNDDGPPAEAASDPLTTAPSMGILRSVQMLSQKIAEWIKSLDEEDDYVTEHATTPKKFHDDATSHMTDNQLIESTHTHQYVENYCSFLALNICITATSEAAQLCACSSPSPTPEEWSEIEERTRILVGNAIHSALLEFDTLAIELWADRFFRRIWRVAMGEVFMRVQATPMLSFPSQRSIGGLLTFASLDECLINRVSKCRLLRGAQSIQGVVPMHEDWIAEEYETEANYYTVLVESDNPPSGMDHFEAAQPPLTIIAASPPLSSLSTETSGADAVDSWEEQELNPQELAHIQMIQRLAEEEELAFQQQVRLLAGDSCPIAAIETLTAIDKLPAEFPSRSFSSSTATSGADEEMESVEGSRSSEEEVEPHVKVTRVSVEAVDPNFLSHESSSATGSADEASVESLKASYDLGEQLTILARERKPSVVEVAAEWEREEAENRRRKPSDAAGADSINGHLPSPPKTIPQRFAVRSIYGGVMDSTLDYVINEELSEADYERMERVKQLSEKEPDEGTGPFQTIGDAEVFGGTIGNTKWKPDEEVGKAVSSRDSTPTSGADSQVGSECESEQKPAAAAGATGEKGPSSTVSSPSTEGADSMADSIEADYSDRLNRETTTGETPLAKQQVSIDSQSSGTSGPDSMGSFEVEEAPELEKEIVEAGSAKVAVMLPRRPPPPRSHMQYTKQFVPLDGPIEEEAGDDETALATGSARLWNKMPYSIPSIIYTSYDEEVADASEPEGGQFPLSEAKIPSAYLDDGEEGVTVDSGRRAERTIDSTTDAADAMTDHDPLRELTSNTEDADSPALSFVPKRPPPPVPPARESVNIAATRDMDSTHGLSEEELEHIARIEREAKQEWGNWEQQQPTSIHFSGEQLESRAIAELPSPKEEWPMLTDEELAHIAMIEESARASGDFSANTWDGSPYAETEEQASPKEMRQCALPSGAAEYEKPKPEEKLFEHEDASAAGTPVEDEIHSESPPSTRTSGPDSALGHGSLASTPTSGADSSAAVSQRHSLDEDDARDVVSTEEQIKDEGKLFTLHNGDNGPPMQIAEWPDKEMVTGTPSEQEEPQSEHSSIEGDAEYEKVQLLLSGAMDVEEVETDALPQKTTDHLAYDELTAEELAHIGRIQLLAEQSYFEATPLATTTIADTTSARLDDKAQGDGENASNLTHSADRRFLEDTLQEADEFANSANEPFKKSPPPEHVAEFAANKEGSSTLLTQEEWEHIARVQRQAEQDDSLSKMDIARESFATARLQPSSSTETYSADSSPQQSPTSGKTNGSNKAASVASTAGSSPASSEVSSPDTSGPDSLDEDQDDKHEEHINAEEVSAVVEYGRAPVRAEDALELGTTLSPHSEPLWIARKSSSSSETSGADGIQPGDEEEDEEAFGYPLAGGLDKQELTERLIVPFEEPSKAGAYFDAINTLDTHGAAARRSSLSVLQDLGTVDAAGTARRQSSLSDTTSTTTVTYTDLLKEYEGKAWSSLSNAWLPARNGETGKQPTSNIKVLITDEKLRASFCEPETEEMEQPSMEIFPSGISRESEQPLPFQTLPPPSSSQVNAYQECERRGRAEPEELLHDDTDMLPQLDILAQRLVEESLECAANDVSSIYSLQLNPRARFFGHPANGYSEVSYSDERLSTPSNETPCDEEEEMLEEETVKEAKLRSQMQGAKKKEGESESDGTASGIAAQILSQLFSPRRRSSVERPSSALPFLRQSSSALGSLISSPFTSSRQQRERIHSTPSATFATESRGHGPSAFAKLVRRSSSREFGEMEPSVELLNLPEEVLAGLTDEEREHVLGVIAASSTAHLNTLSVAQEQTYVAKSDTHPIDAEPPKIMHDEFESVHYWAPDSADIAGEAMQPEARQGSSLGEVSRTPSPRPQSALLEPLTGVEAAANEGLTDEEVEHIRRVMELAEAEDLIGEADYSKQKSPEMSAECGKADSARGSLRGDDSGIDASLSDSILTGLSDEEVDHIRRITEQANREFYDDYHGLPPTSAEFWSTSADSSRGSQPSVDLSTNVGYSPFSGPIANLGQPSEGGKNDEIATEAIRLELELQRMSESLLQGDEWDTRESLVEATNLVNRQSVAGEWIPHEPCEQPHVPITTSTGSAADILSAYISEIEKHPSPSPGQLGENDDEHSTQCSTSSITRMVSPCDADVPRGWSQGQGEDKAGDRAHGGMYGEKWQAGLARAADELGPVLEPAATTIEECHPCMGSGAIDAREPLVPPQPGGTGLSEGRWEKGEWESSGTRFLPRADPDEPISPTKCPIGGNALAARLITGDASNAAYKSQQRVPSLTYSSRTSLGQADEKVEDNDSNDLKEKERVPTPFFLESTTPESILTPEAQTPPKMSKSGVTSGLGGFTTRFGLSKFAADAKGAIKTAKQTGAELGAKASKAAQAAKTQSAHHLVSAHLGLPPRPQSAQSQGVEASSPVIEVPQGLEDLSAEERAQILAVMHAAAMEEEVPEHLGTTVPKLSGSRTIDVLTTQSPQPAVPRRPSEASQPVGPGSKRGSKDFPVTSEASPSDTHHTVMGLEGLSAEEQEKILHVMRMAEEEEFTRPMPIMEPAKEADKKEGVELGLHSENQMNREVEFTNKQKQLPAVVQSSNPPSYTEYKEREEEAIQPPSEPVESEEELKDLYKYGKPAPPTVSEGLEPTGLPAAVAAAAAGAVEPSENGAGVRPTSLDKDDEAWMAKSEYKPPDIWVGSSTSPHVSGFGTGKSRMWTTDFSEDASEIFEADAEQLPLPYSRGAESADHVVSGLEEASGDETDEQITADTVRGCWEMETATTPTQGSFEIQMEDPMSLLTSGMVITSAAAKPENQLMPGVPEITLSAADSPTPRRALVDGGSEDSDATPPSSEDEEDYPDHVIKAPTVVPILASALHQQQELEREAQAAFAKQVLEEIQQSFGESANDEFDVRWATASGSVPAAEERTQQQHQQVSHIGTELPKPPAERIPPVEHMDSNGDAMALDARQMTRINPFLVGDTDGSGLEDMEDGDECRQEGQIEVVQQQIDDDEQRLLNEAEQYYRAQQSPYFSHRPGLVYTIQESEDEASIVNTEGIYKARELERIPLHAAHSAPPPLIPESGIPGRGKKAKNGKLQNGGIDAGHSNASVPVRAAPPPPDSTTPTNSLLSPSAVNGSNAQHSRGFKFTTDIAQADDLYLPPHTHTQVPTSSNTLGSKLESADHAMVTPQQNKISNSIDAYKHMKRSPAMVLSSERAKENEELSAERERQQSSLQQHQEEAGKFAPIKPPHTSSAGDYHQQHQAPQKAPRPNFAAGEMGRRKLPALPATTYACPPPSYATSLLLQQREAEARTRLASPAVEYADASCNGSVSSPLGQGRGIDSSAAAAAAAAIAARRSPLATTPQVYRTTAMLPPSALYHSGKTKDAVESAALHGRYQLQQYSSDPAIRAGATFRVLPQQAHGDSKVGAGASIAGVCSKKDRLPGAHRPVNHTLGQLMFKKELRERLELQKAMLETCDIEANQRRYNINRHITSLAPMGRPPELDSIPAKIVCQLPRELVDGAKVVPAQGSTPRGGAILPKETVISNYSFGQPQPSSAYTTENYGGREPSLKLRRTVGVQSEQENATATRSAATSETIKFNNAFPTPHLPARPPTPPSTTSRNVIDSWTQTAKCAETQTESRYQPFSSEDEEERGETDLAMAEERRLWKKREHHLRKQRQYRRHWFPTQRDPASAEMEEKRRTVEEELKLRRREARLHSSLRDLREAEQAALLYPELLEERSLPLRQYTSLPRLSASDHEEYLPYRRLPYDNGPIPAASLPYAPHYRSEPLGPPHRSGYASLPRNYERRFERGNAVEPLYPFQAQPNYAPWRGDPVFRSMQELRPQNLWPLDDYGMSYLGPPDYRGKRETADDLRTSAPRYNVEGGEEGMLSQYAQYLQRKLLAGRQQDAFDPLLMPEYSHQLPARPTNTMPATSLYHGDLPFPTHEYAIDPPPSSQVYSRREQNYGSCGPLPHPISNYGNHSRYTTGQPPPPALLRASQLGGVDSSFQRPNKLYPPEFRHTDLYSRHRNEPYPLSAEGASRDWPQLASHIHQQMRERRPDRTMLQQQYSKYAPTRTGFNSYATGVDDRVGRGIGGYSSYTGNLAPTTAYGAYADLQSGNYLPSFMSTPLS